MSRAGVMRRWSLSNPVVAWAMYDWANSAYATTVMAGFLPDLLPPVLEQRRGGDARPPGAWASPMARPASSSRCWRRCSARWRTAARAASSSCSPGRWWARWPACAMFFVAQGQWLLAALCFVLRHAGLQRRHRVQRCADHARGRAARLRPRVRAGLCAGLPGRRPAVRAERAMTVKPQWFGLHGAAEAVRWSFVSVGCGGCCSRCR